MNEKLGQNIIEAMRKHDEGRSKEREALKIKTAIMGEKIINIENDVKDIKCTLKEFIESADKKYASKSTEKLVFALIIAFLTAIVGGIIKFILI